MLALGRLFGTDGVRGVVNELLTPELALKLGAAIATYYGEGARILVGRDARVGGDMILHAVVAGLLSSGARVYVAGSQGFAPTPAVQYAVKELGYDAGVIITASHNPPQYNGIKVVGPLGIEIDRDTERKIEEIYFEERFRRIPWSRAINETNTEHRVVNLYVDAVVDRVDKNLIRRRGFRVLVDCANNVSSLTSPEILRKLGVKVYTLACNPGPFPYREPEPTPDSLAEVAAVVRTLGLDMAVGHDGDGDRAIILDEKGEVWWGDRTGTLLAAYIAEEKLPDVPKRLYTAVSSSRLVSDYLEPRGIEVVWTPVGSINLSYRLLEEGGIAGFEENGGFIYPPHLLARDGGMTLALFLEMLAKKGVKASELFSELPRYYAVKTKVPMQREKALKVVEALRNEYEGKPGYRIVTVDGLRVEADDFWFLVRPSGTEPVLRIMVEARSPDRAKELANNLVEKARRLAAL
ncbi:Phosphomannomutase [Pyrodictium delaneyi]|uniref:Phosphomannomutase n=1 Tax=Pyrodictium delaneyi TaxID=1273541 RepID=A0A0P0N3M8_9CREN|nr:phosphoglucosamine mutase [Pyrodictium delaneyi]ALL01020.1 Phosphomannomutase [Pyrodictium delaneyi]